MRRGTLSVRCGTAWSMSEKVTVTLGTGIDMGDIII
jgi:hypothetical protein